MCPQRPGIKPMTFVSRKGTLHLKYSQELYLVFQVLLGLLHLQEFLELHSVQVAQCSWVPDFQVLLWVQLSQVAPWVLKGLVQPGLEGRRKPPIIREESCALHKFHFHLLSCLFHSYMTINHLSCLQSHKEVPGSP